MMRLTVVLLLLLLWSLEMGETMRGGIWRTRD